MVQTTGVNLEGVLANATVIIGAALATCRVLWKRAKTGLGREARAAMAPTIDAVDTLNSTVSSLQRSVEGLRTRMDQLEDQRSARDDK